MALPEGLATALTQPVEVGRAAQAFPFLTVDGDGLPHVALLSAREVAVGGDGAVLVVLDATSTTSANLRRTEGATLVAIEGTTAHTLKLRVRHLLDDEGLLGAVLAPASHRGDSLGIALSPVTFVATDQLARLERWDRSARVLARLATLAP